MAIKDSTKSPMSKESDGAVWKLIIVGAAILVIGWFGGQEYAKVDGMTAQQWKNMHEMYLSFEKPEPTPTVFPTSSPTNKPQAQTAPESKVVNQPVNANFCKQKADAFRQAIGEGYSPDQVEGFVKLAELKCLEGR